MTPVIKLPDNQDALAEILQLQDRLTTYLFEHAEAPVKRGSIEHIQETIACLAVEASEALAPFLTGTKPWKPRDPDITHIDEEMIDCLHYLATYWNLRKMSSNDVLVEYRKKNFRNYQRLADKLSAMEIIVVIAPKE